jgi:hypothetical protein
MLPQCLSPRGRRRLVSMSSQIHALGGQKVSGAFFSEAFMSPSFRCRTVVLSGGDHDVVSLRSAFLNGPRHIPFADSAPHRRSLRG